MSDIDYYRNTLNFNVVSRYDPKINSVIYSSRHAVAYKFDPETQEWNKLPFQGLLSVYRRANLEPGAAVPDPHTLGDLCYYGLFILNRTTPQNFVVGITPTQVLRTMNKPVMSVELQGDLVIVQDGEGDVYGIWLFDKGDREKLLLVIQYALDGELTPLV